MKDDAREALGIVAEGQILQDIEHAQELMDTDGVKFEPYPTLSAVASD